MMWVLILVILVIAGFALPKFGKALLGIAGLLALTLGGVMAYNRMEESAARERVSVHEIQIDSARMHLEYPWRVTGWVRNNSPYRYPP